MAANVSVTYDFSAGTPAIADDVDQNFTDIVDWINTNAVHLDGSKAFTNVPSGPATDPSTGNQLTRKAYVDAKVWATANIQDASITKAKLSASSGELGAAWTSYTPTLTNVSSGSPTGAYLLVGKTLHFRFTLPNGASATSAGTIKFTLPSGLLAAAQQVPAARRSNQLVLALTDTGDNKVTVYADHAGTSFTTSQAIGTMNVTGVIEVQ